MSDWPQRLIAFLAPRNRRDFWLKFLYWTAFDMLLAVAIAGALRSAGRMTYPGWALDAALLALFVSMPITVLILFLVCFQRRQLAVMEQLAETDELTGLPNRRAFFRRTTSMRYRVRHGHVFLADADHFKRVNDRYGHEAGDECLAAIADRLRSLDAPGLVYARMGGEEFALLLPVNDRITPEELGEALCAPISVTLSGSETQLTLTLSAGAAYLTEDDSIDRALIWADSALYRAKAAGRGRAFIDHNTTGRQLDAVANGGGAAIRKALA